ncbi:hypothetical protein [Corynebacterium sp. MC3]|uniref:hypothetical protein n=1 Tax=Corynebacterium sp. MC3 TaxID=1720193 RepID=UPI0008DAB646|nr:hypothetical protein [Corynebacterium sp. MC3]
MRFEPNFKEFHKILNGQPMKSWIGKIGAQVHAAAVAGTRRKTGTNAGSIGLDVKPYSGPWGDRVVAEIRNSNDRYGLERELGGRVNPRPERSLYYAMVAVAGGHAVAKPGIVYGKPARRTKPKPFLTRNKYGRL